MKDETRRAFLARAVGAVTLATVPTGWICSAAEGDEFSLKSGDNIIPAPKEPSLWPAFREKLAEWRIEARGKMGYDDALYRDPAYAWCTSSFACCFVMMCDETFYNPNAGQYTIDAFLDHGQSEFGGYDSLVLWHAYPRIGLDDRNQFDFYRDMPGGIAGLRKVVEAIQQRGTRVYIDYNPWDTGTRREGKPDIDMLVDMVRQLNVDGIFLDTMNEGATELRFGLNAARPGVVLEGECILPLERIADHHASWAQWFDDSHAPGVLRNKWFERRHMQHQIKRWHLDHSGELQTAWMNGSGMMIWENVFGSWVGWNPRDRSLLRSMLPIQRRYASLFAGEQWTPLVPTEQPDVYASLWEKDTLHIWTLVNRSQTPVEGVLLKTSPVAGHQWFDLIAGRPLQPKEIDGQLVIEGNLRPHGIGCFLAAAEESLKPDFAAFLAAQRTVDARAVWDTTHPMHKNRLTVTPPTERVSQIPQGMVEVPAASLTLTTKLRFRECGFYKASPPAEHANFIPTRPYDEEVFERPVKIERFAMDVTSVTNAQYAEFLQASGYKPSHPENFLKHWQDGKPPVGKEDHPVVYVDLDDARAYARWAGKRLPTEEEWQYAAQGNDGRVYPWGNEMLPERCNGGERGDTTPVTEFPGGRSPFGCYDMCGNVWQWTESERSDGRTRFCILRGGSYYSVRSSVWYMDGGPRPVGFGVKFLLMWSGLDRCATIGFRCVKDLAVN